MDRQTKVIGIGATALILIGVTALYAQDKYSLISPGGIAFSDFRGYEDWSVVSSARTAEVLKVIVANPTMINAYKAGIPGNGQHFPDGSKIVKLDSVLSMGKPGNEAFMKTCWPCHAKAETSDFVFSRYAP
jgi:hypothetical protein